MLCGAKLHITNVATMFFFVQALDRKICVYLQSVGDKNNHPCGRNNF